MDKCDVSNENHMTSINTVMTSNNDDQDIEINQLRDSFKDKIRILSSIGQFSYILKIRLEEYDVSLTLQLDQSYPSKAPEIIITAPRLNPDQIILIQQLLQAYCETILNKPMVSSIHSRLTQWFVDNNIQKLSVDSTNDNTNSSASLAQRSQQKNSKTNSPVAAIQHHDKTDHHDDESAKRSSMKTADDVISRIEWDDRLDKRHFRVGYIDRFLGIQEKAFTDFDFNVDLSTISDRHSTVLAIPKHRIQYFKYDNEIIWDKETRTDLMFGSTGSQETICDVIERHEKHLRNNDSSPIVENQVIDDTNVTAFVPRFLTFTDGVYKPNYFLSVPITDPNLINNYLVNQNRLLSSYPSLFSVHTTSANLHLTLLTLYIETPSQIESCINILKSLQDEIRQHCSHPDKICLEFKDINAFHDKILYVSCQENQRLNNLRTLIVQRFCDEQQKPENHGIYLAGNHYEFVPHVTVLKCKRKCSSACPNEIKQIDFGQQTIHCLQLCSIGKRENEEQNSNCVFELDIN